MSAEDANVSSSKKKFTATQVVIAVLVSAVVIALLMFQFGARMFEAGGGRNKTLDDYDEDRPPVIITNGGSVNFESKLGGKNGVWTRDAGLQGWRHVVAGAPPVASLMLLHDSGPDRDNCEGKGLSQLNPPFVGTAMVVSVGKASPTTWQSVKLSITQDAAADLLLKFDAEPDQANNILTHAKGNRDVKVRQVSIIGLDSQPTYVCTYAQGANSIKIAQVK